jgi:hypothetical protein
MRIITLSGLWSGSDATETMNLLPLGLFLGRAAIACRHRSTVGEIPDLTSYRLWFHFSKVFGDGVTQGGQLKVLCGEALGVVCSPSNERGVIYLMRNGISKV